MRFRVLDQASQRFLQTAAIILITGFVAGCSTDVMRFTDGIYTGSTPNQRSTINKRPAAQPYPQAASSAPAVDRNYTGSISRAAVTPVTRSPGVERASLPPVSSAPVAAATPPRQPAPVAASAPQTVQPAPAQQMASANPPPVSGAAGEVIVQPGESLFGIANRVGVSPNALMQANGITDANRIQAGQRLKLPGGQGGSGRGVIAADGTRTSGSGAQQGKVLGQLPQNPAAPAHRPANSDVAILPQTPTIKEKQPGVVAQSSTAPTATTPPARGGSYMVQSGDSLYGISQKTGASVEEIKKANGLANGAIRVGQSLVIPGGAAPAATTQVAAAQPKLDQVKTGSTPPPAGPQAQPQQPAPSNVKPYTPPQTSKKVIEDAETDVASAPSSTGISQMRWPVRGRVLSSFGQREGGSVNDGIDIMVPEGTPVKAAENGVVIYAGDGLKEFGNTVLVRHENGLVTVYGHNSQITVQRGQKVRRGEEIARSGMSGNAKSPKLHFEVRKNSSPVNPSKYLES
ncbi:LysM peptidoglycan-binding domain-containing M23 family metallopeptidase [Brucella endophytica]|nr:LysM peptidoglycan-binding domain-containing M23 family metallopeptidase [Brucella endophytica]